MRTTSSSALSRNARISSSKSPPTSISASSRKGSAPHSAISLAICRATQVSRALWLTKTRRFFLRRRGIAGPFQASSYTLRDNTCSPIVSESHRDGMDKGRRDIEHSLLEFANDLAKFLAAVLPDFAQSSEDLFAGFRGLFQQPFPQLGRQRIPRAKLLHDFFDLR